ncbi:MAG: dicarboxylate/amino acid:cation symporter [Verrucomicrobia bacterium]|nr:MAG: dicarboxylate/amino acid:cation symporter [Verrucomicrobiota bacterium]
MIRLKLHWQILIALGAAFVVGALVGRLPETSQAPWLKGFDFLGTLFLNALKMLVVPLIASAIITGVAGIGPTKALGRLGLKTLLYYTLTTLISVLVGLLLVTWIRPGIVEGRPARDVVGLEAQTAEVLEGMSERGAGDLLGIFLRMVPTNIVASAAEGDMLGLIFFSLVFGFFMMRLPKARYERLLGFWEDVNEVMMLMTHWVMKFAPVGVFALVAKVIAPIGWEALRPLGMFFLTVLAGLAIHFGVVLPLLLLLVGRVNPWRHYRAMLPALLTGFSTASSSATLPVTVECVTRRAGVSNRVAGFTLPLGATVNMDGTALYECVAAVFIAQAYGVNLAFGELFTVVLLALLTSIGVAGIPSASLVAILIILHAVGLPAEGLGLILAVDRILDMCRTSVNLFSDSCAAVVIARTEGETAVLQKPPEAMEEG